VTIDTKVGEERHKFTVTKDLLARLIAPRFLTERDEATISGIVHNYLKTSEKVRAEFSAEGVAQKNRAPQESQIASGGSHRFDWNVTAGSDKEARLTLKALTVKTSDALMQKIPILPHGTEKFAARAGDTSDRAEVRHRASPGEHKRLSIHENNPLPVPGGGHAPGPQVPDRLPLRLRGTDHEPLPAQRDRGKIDEGSFPV